MDGFLEVAAIGEVADGTLKKVTVQGREILLARSGSMIFAADNRCPHLAADLSEGSLAGTILTCPAHRSQFDLRDGRVVRWTDLHGRVLMAAMLTRPPRPLRVYRAKIEGDRIFVSREAG